ncbi:hypothetical protein BOO21_19560 [Vibrio cidicii]|nr:hypothetical protein [Vibrio cidicii]
MGKIDHNAQMVQPRIIYKISSIIMILSVGTAQRLLFELYLQDSSFQSPGLHIILFLLLGLTSTNPAFQRIYTMAP